MDLSNINKIVVTDGVEGKAPQDVLFDVPQEQLTGDVLRGYGPRRGNLERLLRYWRPIMRKPGGFRRCRVILADHPELYPLNNICAWLHHETTGLWPNEGCHHPGMKNCRKKLKGVVRGSIWSDSDFNERMRKLRKRTGKKEFTMPDKEEASRYVVTESDIEHANMVLKDFMEMEPKFMSYLADDKNWIHEGMDEKENWTPHEWVKPDSPCKCGCG
jgi:hypothetical protein